MLALSEKAPLKGGAKPPKAIAKPYSRHILGIDSGVQSHTKATPRPHQGYTKATPKPPRSHPHATLKPPIGRPQATRPSAGRLDVKLAICQVFHARPAGRIEATIWHANHLRPLSPARPAGRTG